MRCMKSNFNSKVDDLGDFDELVINKVDVGGCNLRWHGCPVGRVSAGRWVPEGSTCGAWWIRPGPCRKFPQAVNEFFEWDRQFFAMWFRSCWQQCFLEVIVVFVKISDTAVKVIFHVYVCFFGGRRSRFNMCPNISICCASAASIEICIVLKPLASDGGYLTVEVGTSEPGTDARSVLHVTWCADSN